MKVYAVKLDNENPPTDNSAILSGFMFNKDGYLCEVGSDQPEIYEINQAKRKAEFFGGKAIPYGKNYVTSQVTVKQFDKSILQPLIVEAARKKIAYKYVKDNLLAIPQDMFICYGNVFDDILEEGGIPAEIIEELRILSVMCRAIDYVHFL